MHDVNTIEETIDNLLIDPKNITIVADAGYINFEIKNKLKETKNINLIVQDKSNSIIKNTRIEKEKLKDRHIVENFYSWLKKNKRIPVRMDSLDVSYMGFVYLAYLTVLRNKI